MFGDSALFTMSDVAAFHNLLIVLAVFSPGWPVDTCASDPRVIPASPIAPDATLNFLHPAPGLRIELAACEPQVIDPVEARFDERGRLWVVEMRDYPYGPAAGQLPRSRIKLLEDRDGDGRFETAHVFADQLLFANGLQPWRDGVIVTLAGQIAYLKDSDGDNRADEVETWYRGFAQENSQLRANHPRWALDGFVYVANGLRGGTAVDARRPDAPVLQLSGRDFRFHPRTGQYEAISGVGQFGLTFDAAGNRFICSNRNPLMHVVIEDRYLKRNPLAAIPATTNDVARFGEDSKLFPLSRAWTTSNLHAGQFTAACGVLIYRGDALPSRYRDQGFVCDPTGDLVHCEILHPRDTTFTSLPEQDGSEFLASPDEWFRPVNLEAGPDGGLYVVDMYRAVIEHPDFMPAELKRRPDLLDGTDRGRIYRITSADRGPRQAVASLAEMSNDQLVALLGHANAWHGDTAARLLVERQAQGVIPALEGVVSRHAIPLARLRGLAVLHDVGRLEPRLLETSLSDADPRVRRMALLFAESRWDAEPSLMAAALRCAEDPAAAVRCQLALSLTMAAEPAPVASLERIAMGGLGDVWTQRAVLLAARQPAALGRRLLRELAATPDASQESLLSLVGELAASTAAAGDRAGLRELFESVLDLPPAVELDIARFRLTAGLAKAASRARISLEEALQGDDQPARRARLTSGLASLRARASEAARGSVPKPVQEAAIDLLAYAPQLPPVLVELVQRDEIQVVRVRALTALAHYADTSPWVGLLGGFGRESPAVRRAILDAVLSRPDRAALLLDAIERGAIRPAEIGPSTAQRLTRMPDAALRARATRDLAAALPADRQKALADYQPVLAMRGEPRHGRELFSKHCATCHRIGDLGVNVAPDIADSRDKTPAQILADILQPNRAVDGNYIGYAVMLKDGRTLSGILASETATSITLKQPEAKSVTLRRDEVELLQSTGLSLMPEGLEKDIPPQDMADLISFIKNWRYLDGRTPATNSVPDPKNTGRN